MKQELDTEQETPVRDRPWLKWGLVLGGATLLGVFFASRTYILYNFYPDNEIGLVEALAPALTDWYLWALLVPGILWGVRRYPIESGAVGRNLAIHVAFGAAVASAKFFLDLGAGAVLPWISPGALNGPRFVMSAYPNFITYWVIIVILHAIDYARKYRDRQLRASRLETRLAQVQLQVLRMQIQPHFLFNTLHAISTLMHRDADAADRMLVRLSDLLRLTIEKIGVHEVSLKEELEFLRSYLDIERTRFRDRLSVEIEVDPETLDARVPNLLLQPLVENAIRHGIAPRPDPGRVEVRAAREDGTLVLAIRDDGPGLPGDPGDPTGPGAEAGRDDANGLGLSNTRARLAQLYGPAGRLELRNHPDGGLEVTVRIPYRDDGTGDDAVHGERPAIRIERPAVPGGPAGEDGPR